MIEKKQSICHIHRVRLSFGSAAAADHLPVLLFPVAVDSLFFALFALAWSSNETLKDVAV